LFTFTFSPVQSFIAEARRGQDLFAGSYILAQLARAALHRITQRVAGAEPIYPPIVRGEPLPKDIPNKMTLIAPDKAAAERMGTEARDALIDRWKEFAQDARAEANNWGVKPDRRWEEIWDRQVRHLWECYWAAIPMTSNYKADFMRLNTLLDANKRLRAFAPTLEDGLKDSLSGNRSALRRQDQDAEAYWRAVFELTPNKTRKFNIAKLRDDGRERLDAIGVIKRFLDDRDLPDIRSTSSIASEPFLQKAILKAPDALRQYTNAVRELLGTAAIKVRRYEPGGWGYDGDLLYRDTLTPERLKEEYGLRIVKANKALSNAKASLNNLYAAVGDSANPERPCLYYAILQMDGDSMGEYISQLQDKEAHKKFSSSVSDFSKKVAATIQDHNGAAVYAGGDDVLGLLPLEQVMPCAQKLAALFSDTQRTLSAGIAIVHHTQPLSLALHMASRAEQTAKNMTGKSAVAVRAAKRSGGDVLAVAKWEHMDKFEALVGAIADKSLSSKCAYDVREMADDFMPIADIQEAQQPMTKSARLGAFKSQMRQQIDRHWKSLSNTVTEDEKKAQQARKAKLTTDLEAWLDAPATDPCSLGDWIVLARFVALRGEE
jgi:CRISPR-associated protein Cmr2